MRPVWAEIDLGAITRNVARLAAVAAPARMCAVVKADGYGHGAVASAQAALAGGADCLAVALVSEGVALREAGIDGPILVLSHAAGEDLDLLIGHDLEPTAYTDAFVAALGVAADRAGRSSTNPVRTHLKVDTGMHRVGANPGEAVALAAAIEAAPGLVLAAVSTHCAVADEPANPFTAIQLDRFEEAVAAIEAAGFAIPYRHAANTAATITCSRSRYDMVRCGIGIYGLDPSSALAGLVDLEPSLSLRAQVSHVQRVPAGEGISYGLRYRPATDATIATVPIGYGDGTPRRLGATGGQVLIGGRHRPIAGTVTMDQILVDCGDDPVAVGDDVVLLGRQDEATISAQDWADRLDTITYEIVCGIGPRVPRRYLEQPS